MLTKVRLLTRGWIARDTQHTQTEHAQGSRTRGGLMGRSSGREYLYTTLSVYSSRYRAAVCRGSSRNMASTRVATVLYFVNHSFIPCNIYKYSVFNYVMLIYVNIFSVHVFITMVYYVSIFSVNLI